ncbi:uncharacterized protein LOC132733502 [Ruditapes philippinarum]|uniref:uncharacterized protein LOC132733502 n=1 Tax=Ruditapes philippinarum TaxID=129788 RepID=UPI00295AE662|nr:uncharacterized protein LOC132733502 [Ruditapes philippinarum]
MNIREHYTNNEDSSWYKMFMDILPQLDSQLQPYVQDIANQGVDELHGYLFDQSIELLFTFGLRDVAFTSHRLYDNLRGYFDMEDMYPQDRENMLKESVRMSLWDIWCPVSYEIIENHRKIVMMFKNEFEMTEQMHICPKVADFLYRYIDNNLPWHNATFENTQGFWMLCDLVGDIVKETVEGYKDYENFLSTMNIGDLESVLQKYLTDEDWKVFTEALRRLGFFDTNVVRSLGRISSKWLKRK